MREAQEESTYFVDITFRDEDDDVVVPDQDTVFWSLTDKSGDVIRETNDQLGLTSVIVTHNVEQMKKLVLLNSKGKFSLNLE